MSTFERLCDSIDAKRRRGCLTPAFIESTKSKMDVFLMNDRISEKDYNELLDLMKEGNVKL